MSSLLCSSTLRHERRHGRSVYVRRDIALDALFDALGRDGDALKVSHKAAVRRVGKAVIKETQGSFLARTLKLTLQKAKYRRPWLAAHYLQERGVHVPAPMAYLERGRLGFVTGAVMVSEYLHGYGNVEKYLAAMVDHKVPAGSIKTFLFNLADAVNGLTAAGAYHADLSGKNIFTRDGKTFYFIDLDAVELEADYDDVKRLKNHIQLYDSFCDWLHDPVLVPFIARMLPPDKDPRVWLPKVREGQEARRAKLAARREKKQRT